MLSAVQERLQEQLSPLRAWLFPPRVFLQLEDRAITALVLEHRRVVWLERVVIPAGLCERGEPVNAEALGDLIGDLLVTRGFAAARLEAVLPPAASELRLIRWPGGQRPEQPERWLDLHQEPLRLPQAVQYLDLHLLDLALAPPASLLLAAPRQLLERWVEVFTLAGVSLERLESAALCLCRAVQPLLGLEGGEGCGDVGLVLQVEAERTGLLLLEQGVPAYQRRLPGSGSPEALAEELHRCLAFWRQLRPEWVSPPLLLLHGAGLADPALAPALAAALGCPWRCLDPLALGWLDDDTPPAAAAAADDDDATERPPGYLLAGLWGLVATDLQP